MITTLSSKGQVVLPRQVRNRLRLSPGAKLICEVLNDQIILRPETPMVVSQDYIIDKVSGLRVVKQSKHSPVLTTQRVKAIMADFP